jgi:hypothetical protein
MTERCPTSERSVSALATDADETAAGSRPRRLRRPEVAEKVDKVRVESSTEGR